MSVELSCAAKCQTNLECGNCEIARKFLKGLGKRKRDSDTVMLAKKHGRAMADITEGVYHYYGEEPDYNGLVWVPGI